jgi:hypothetical protein
MLLGNVYVITLLALVNWYPILKVINQQQLLPGTDIGGVTQMTTKILSPSVKLLSMEAGMCWPLGEQSSDIIC